MTKTKIMMFIIKCNTLDLQKNIYRKQKRATNLIKLRNIMEYDKYGVV